MRKIIICTIIGLVTLGLKAQDESNLVSETFSGIKIINGQSTKTLKKREFRYIIEHRFGDIGGDAGGVQTGFGFDNAADIRFGFDFGLNDKWMAGVSRLKGSGAPYKSIIDITSKYRLLQQTKDNKVPVSLAISGSADYTYMTKSEDLSLVTSFPKLAHRFLYSTQIIATRKFGERLSLAVMPTYVHRNYVRFDDVNGLFAIGGAFNVKVTKKIGIIAEYFQTLSSLEGRKDYTNSLGIGMEWITNGHVFHFNFTNAKGIGEAQFIPYTTSDWLEGEFRFGFSIARTFKY